MKSKIYSSDYMKTATKGQLWIPVLLSIGYLMAFLVLTILQLGNWFGTESMKMEQIQNLYEMLWTDSLMATGFVVTSVGAVVNGINHFWYLYSSKKTDFYHCLPISRSKSFLHKLVMGILYYLIPYIIMEFMTVCVGAMRGFFSLKIMKMALQMLVMHLILYLLFYFAVVLVVCITGNILMGGLCLAGIFLYGNVLGMLLGYYRSVFYRNAYTEETWGLIKILEEYSSPYTLGKSFLCAYSSGHYLKFLGFLMTVIVILAALSYFAYMKRPSESAGKPMIYQWSGVVIKFMVVIPFGLGCGLIFYTLPQQNSRIIWWILGMIFGTVLSHGVIEVLYQMDFRKFLSKKVQLLAAGLFVAMFALNYRMDLQKFDDYIPDRESIEALNADLTGILQCNYISKKEDGTYVMIGSWTSEETALTGENGVGEKTWNEIKNIISKQNQRNAGYRYAGNYVDSEEGWRYSLPVKFTLKNGREIYRRYYLDSEDVSGLLECLYEEGRLKEINNAFLTIEEKYLKSVFGTFMDGKYYALFQEEPQKYTEFLHALRDDLEDASPEELLGEPCAYLEFQYEIPRIPDSYDINIHADGYVYDTLYAEVMVFPSFERTLAILEKTGYPLTGEDVDISSITVTYWDVDTTYQESAYHEVTYKEKDELDQLKQALVPYRLKACWKEYENVDVQYELKNGGDWYGSSGYLVSDRTPGFVREEEENSSPGTEVELQQAEEE